MDSVKTLIQGRDEEPTALDGRIRARDDRAHRDGEVVLGRYRLIERLGAGGFGTVWHAHDEQLDRPVALKRIPLPSEEDRHRALREAHATARLSHPSIVALYEASATQDAFYLASELVRGATLAELIAADALTDEQLLEIGLALCRALEHAHARGVVHRDVKPHNVLVPAEEDLGCEAHGRGDPQAVAKLADFGGARLAGDEGLTRAGDVIGTLAYMAPEQSDGDQVGPEADLYSLALVLYEGLSGVNPVRGLTPAATARRIGAPIERLERRRRDLPRELTRAFDAALNSDPQRRGTLAGMADSIEAALETGLRRPLLRRARPAPCVGLDEAEQQDLDEHPRPFSLPRTVWVGALLAVALWQAAAGRPGASVLVLAAGAPLLALANRSGPAWLAAALAPLLGLLGLAAAFPALAGQRLDWRARGGLAALGFWWLALAEPLFQRHLWLGPPSGAFAQGAWESSVSKALEMVGATVTLELPIGLAVWALAAILLPWIVRGRHAALDLVAALVWTVAALASAPMLERALLGHVAQPAPRGALLGAALGCMLAVCARAVRGPV